jgi:glycerol-3-phosphate acyltransferase PlsX
MATIAVDAMGAGGGPRAVVEAVGAVSAAADTQCILVGPERQIQELLDQVAYNAENIDIVDAADAIAVDEDPVAALGKRKASLLVATRLVESGRADALVSGGNAGAALRACLQYLPRIGGIEKVAVAAVYPRAVERSGQDPLALLLDVGATVHCAARDLVAFGIMGSSYVRCAKRNRDPRVGLLNMAQRSSAGGEHLAAAYERLGRLPDLSFVGNVEGHEIATGRADVLICEGLLGNVVLKMVHELAGMAVDFSRAARARSWYRRAGMAVLGGGAAHRPLLDYESYGGAPLLGFEAGVVVVHPQSPVAAIRSAIDAAATASRAGLAGEIQKMLKEAALWS